MGIGVEVFDETGALRNAIAAGDGAILNVPPGATVTVATDTMAVLTHSQLLTLNTAGTGANTLRNGSGRVVATSTQVGCVALAVDRLHSIQDPAVCPTCQPPSLATRPLELSTTSTSPPPQPCAPTPVTGCQAAAAEKALLRLGKGSTPAENNLTWKWVSSGTVNLSDFGSPTTTTGYVLCVYDSTGLRMTTHAPADRVCGTKPCWNALGTTGFKYGDKTGAPDGVTKALLRAGSAGQAKIGMKGKGANLPVPTLPLTTPVQVQLQRSGSSACWEAKYSTVTTNTASAFKAKSD